MEFEWDERKARRNIAKHGVPFEYSTRVFLDSYRVDAADPRRDYGEERRVVPGIVEGRLFAVAHTLSRQDRSADFVAEG
jgi:uncharacterized DUF497 family protein